MPSDGKLKRFLKLSGMTASVAGRYLGTRLVGAVTSKESLKERLVKTHERAGSRIAKTLGELKGPVMKLGQLASVSSGLLPPELSAKLEILRRKAPPAPYEVIAAQIETELGDAPERLFRRFDREPYAAASIGQVHRAQLDDGREVVVKVQYPEIGSSVDADLAQLRMAFRAIGWMRRSTTTVDSFFEEVRSHLHEELDYTLEADNVRLLADFHANRHPFVRIPEVIGERSAQRVLTLTFEDGDPLEDASGYSQQIRDLIGDRLLELIYSEIFGLGALHADPNPANFAFCSDGTFALYDFGCIKRFTRDELAGMRDILSGAFAEDYDAIERGLVTMGARNLDGPPVDPALYRDLRALISPALDPEVPFDAGQSTIHRKVPALLPRFRKNMASFSLPAGMMLVQRVNVGTYGNLRKLGARVHLRRVVEGAMAATPGSSSQP